jgi:hypothetical protein
MLKLTCKPIWSTPKSLSGELLTDGERFCYWLTLPAKDGLPGSAIPPGIYPVTLSPSPKFQKIAQTNAWFAPYADSIPHIDDIPNRSTILIHVGNTVDDTDGCILVGQAHSEDSVSGSRSAFAALHALILAADSCTLEMLPYDLPSNFFSVQEAATGF